MEPFSISCTTCQAKLRVRDPSAIGQILTCPKCGSMVLIEAPGETPTHDSEIKGTHAPKPPARSPSKSGISKRPDPFADTVEDPTHYGTVTSSPETTEADPSGAEPIAVPDFESAPDAEEGLAESNLTEAEWISDAARQRRRWLLAGISMLAGISLAVAVFVYVVGRLNSTSTAQNQPMDSGTANPPESPGNSAATDASTSVSEDLPPPASSQPTATPSPTPTAEESVPAAPEPPPPATPAVTEPATLPEPSRQGSQTEASAKLPDAPPDLSPAPDTSSSDDRVKADRTAPGGNLSETLRKLGGLSEDPAVPPPPTAEPAAPAPAEAPLVAEPAKLPRPAPREVDLTARLADPIAAIECTNQPLQDFLGFMTSYSTIPITLDADALVWLNLTPNSPVTIKQTNTTVQKLLDAALEKMGLAAVPVENQIFVTRRVRNSEGALRKTQRKADDLLGAGDGQADLLLSHIQTLVSPTSWAAQGGKGTLQFENGMLVLQNADDVLIEVSALLERLRVARGLPKQSKFDEKIFQPVSRTTRAIAALDKPVTLNYSRPTSLVMLVQRLGRDAGVSIVIDWRTLAEAGWNPDAEVTLTVNGEPLKEALNKLLQPMDLAYRVVDEATFQITTLAGMPNEIEFYPVAELVTEATKDELLAKIHADLPAEWFSESDARIVFDPPSRCLIALLPQPRQQQLEKLLQQWKPAGK